MGYKNPSRSSCGCHPGYLRIKTMYSLITLVLALVSQRVHAHGGVLAYSNGGKWYDGFHPYNTPIGQSTIQRQWATYDPITDPTASTVACNNDGSTLPSGQLTATIAAGSAVTAFWNQWPHNTGPVMTYLGQCPGSTCTGVSPNSLKWFKIDEAGLLSGTIGNGTWAAGKMMAQNNSWTTTIPSTVPSGNYLLRFETIALHSLPAQIYPECAQVTITGGGSKAPLASELVSFPGGYSPSDPGLTVNLYTQEAQVTTFYPIPGPPIYGSGGFPLAQTTTTTHSTSATPTPTPTGGTVAHYGQCGGIGYTGPTGCVSPYTCTYVNDYYSQCL
ncbi:carbohydrate-binding module family 1 protein [Amanita thiersii Skay4041]|uniref:AA9 family lytic polysaccharide monooxygenase n=1 Tax=Amanita thiersii Skay4041 TaxID=703135 RepID=A0A2A9NDV1_9AGAR|nr:carbohydrate-binding module family 1 protein [Amanita thiersii Skay4041]